MDQVKVEKGGVQGEMDWEKEKRAGSKEGLGQKGWGAGSEKAWDMNANCMAMVMGARYSPSSAGRTCSNVRLS